MRGGLATPHAYGLNNPSRMIDPSGHSACDVAGADPECNEPDVKYAATINERIEQKRKEDSARQNSMKNPLDWDDNHNEPICPRIDCCCWAKQTPQPELAAPTHVTVSVNWQYLINWNAFDEVGAFIDIFGIIGDASSYFGIPGKAVWFASEIPEAGMTVVDLAAFAKSGFDLATKGDSSGVTLELLGQQLAKTAIDNQKLSSTYGFVINAYSLGSNFINSIDPKSITIIGPK